MTRLPTGFNNLIIGTIYPPGADEPAMLDYLSCCLSTLESRNPNSGLILLGDQIIICTNLSNSLQEVETPLTLS